MQYFALDLDYQRVPAHLAKKGQNYICPECTAIVRKRTSKKQRAHFYHVQDRKTCPHKRKSQIHLAIQYALFHSFAEEKVYLEHRFEEIQRIADVALPNRGLVFEIQCSKISLKEIEEREADYQKLGLQIVWILYDKIFNKRTVSPSEMRLRKSPCYYTNSRLIYDQLEVIEGKKRLYRSIPYPINIRIPLINDRPGQEKKLYFRGDILDKFASYPSYKEWAEELILSYKKKESWLKTLEKALTLLAEKYNDFLTLLYLYTHENSMTFPGLGPFHKGSALTRKSNYFHRK